VTNTLVFILYKDKTLCQADKGQLDHKATETSCTFLWTRLYIFSWQEKMCLWLIFIMPTLCYTWERGGLVMWPLKGNFGITAV